MVPLAYGMYVVNHQLEGVARMRGSIRLSSTGRLAMRPAGVQQCSQRCVRTALQEVNAREEAGEFIAGALGAGGAHPMRTSEERRARAAAAAAAEAGDHGAGQVDNPTVIIEHIFPCPSPAPTQLATENLSHICLPHLQSLYRAVQLARRNAVDHHLTIEPCTAPSVTAQPDAQTHQMYPYKSTQRLLTTPYSAGAWSLGSSMSSAVEPLLVKPLMKPLLGADMLQADEDTNLDNCVLCGLGGALICCDGCPAAVHLRCVGETAKSIPDGEWLCAECRMGSRGARPSVSARLAYHQCAPDDATAVQVGLPLGSISAC